MRFLGLILFCLLCYMSYDIWYGRNGVEQYDTVSLHFDNLKAKSSALTLQNQALSDEINDLKQGNLAVEELARSELGMIRAQEKIFRVIGEKTQGSDNGDKRQTITEADKNDTTGQ